MTPGGSHTPSLLERSIDLPLHRPRWVLAMTAALMLLAAAALTRVRMDPSLESMFPRNDPSAKALVTVLNEFGAVEELLVLASVPESVTRPAAPDPQRLAAFATRFEAAMKSDTGTSQLIEGIAWRVDDDTINFVKNVIGPAGLYYLSDTEYAEAKQRLTPAEMRVQLEQNAAMLAQPGPAATAMAKVLMKDPLRLRDFIMGRLSAGRAFKTYQGGQEFISPDGKAVLIRVMGRKAPSDLEFSKQLTAITQRVANDANADGLTVAFGGGYPIAAASERAIRGDMKSSIAGSIVFLTILFIVAYRNPARLFALAFAPLVVGALIGFGAYAAIWPTLTPLTGAVGAILAGMGIDYSVYYLSSYERLRAAARRPVDAARESGRDVLPAIVAGCVTSVLGFIAIAGSTVTALGDFAKLGSIGLAGTLLASAILLPAVLVLTDWRPAETLRNRRGARLSDALERLIQLIARRPRPFIAVSCLSILLAIGLIALLPGQVFSIEPDLAVIHPRPNPALDTQDEIGRRFGSTPGSMVVYMKASTPEALIALAHDVDRRLATPAARSASIASTFGLATLLPDPRVVKQRAEAVSQADADRVVADFRAAIEESPFDPKKFADYADILNSLLTNRNVPTLQSLLEYPALAKTFLPHDALPHPAVGGATTAPEVVPPTQAITLLFLSAGESDRAARQRAIETARAALADLPGVTLTGMDVLGHDTAGAVKRELPRLFAVAGILIVLFLLVTFRSLRDALLSVLPAACSLIILLEVMRTTGQSLNMINLIAVPLLMGLDVDYGIFLVSLARAGRRRGESSEQIAQRIGTSCHAVTVCAMTNVLGFGSLMITSVPAIRSLGFAVGLGVFICWLATMLLLVPLLVGKPETDRTKPSEVNDLAK